MYHKSCSVLVLKLCTCQNSLPVNRSQIYRLIGRSKVMLLVRTFKLTRYRFSMLAIKDIMNSAIIKYNSYAYKVNLKAMHLRPVLMKYKKLCTYFVYVTQIYD